MQHLREADLCFFQVELTALNAAHIQDIIDQREQMVAGGQDLAQIVLDLVLVVNAADRQCGEADDGIHGRADIVRHVGKEGTLCPVGSLRCTDCLRKGLVHFPVRGTVRQNQYVFLSPAYLAAHGDAVKPVPLPCLLMDIFRIPFLLLLDLDLFQVVLLRVLRLFRMQLSQDANILADLTCLDAQQLFRVGTDVIRPVGFRIQHQEHVIHVHGQLLKQLVSVKDLRVFFLKTFPALFYDQVYKESGNTDHDPADHEHGAKL